MIGAGSAGLHAMSEVRKRAQDFLMIQGGPDGTTCARTGCMPSKALVQAASDYHRRHQFEVQGIRGSKGVTVDLAAVLRHVRKLRDGFVEGVIESVEKLGDRLVRGYARFLAPDLVEVDGQRFRASRIIIATGSRPVIPDGTPSDPRIFTSEEIFERESLGGRIAVVGAGPEGVEIAQALARFGREVSLFGVGGSLGGARDDRIVAEIRQFLSQELDLRIGERARISAGPDGIRIATGAETHAYDLVLLAAGRRPNLESLRLETLGVPLNEHGVPPFDRSTGQVGDLPVFIAGDANGGRMILHEAADDGRIAGFNATSAELRCFQRRTPLSITFSEPAIVQVGDRLSDLQAAATITAEVSFADQGRSRLMGQNLGSLVVYADRETGKLRGAELCAPEGEHLGHLLAWVIQAGLDVHQVLALPFYHPTIEEGLQTAMRDLAQQLSKRKDAGDAHDLELSSVKRSSSDLQQ